jgi:hypothetical protein
MRASSSTRRPLAVSRAILLFAVVFLISAVVPAAAQEEPSVDGRSTIHAIGDVARQVATDPTTYAPAAILFTSLRLDWSSSQPLFHQGFVEDNPRYTQSGLPHDVPVSYREGNRRILLDALANLSPMIVNNTVSRFSERALVNRFPDHPRLIHALGWIERISFSAYLSYQLSSRHFEQWQRNKQMAAALGNQ